MGWVRMRGSGMAEPGRATERLSEYDGSQSECAGPLGVSEEVERAKGRLDHTSRMKSDWPWIGLDSGRSPRCVIAR